MSDLIYGYHWFHEVVYQIEVEEVDTLRKSNFMVRFTAPHVPLLQGDCQDMDKNIGDFQEFPGMLFACIYPPVVKHGNGKWNIYR